MSIPFVSGSYKLFNCARIAVSIHWSTLIFFGIAALFYSLEDLYVIGIAFISLIPHEYGHALAARWYGIDTKHIVLLPIGGVALLENMPKEPKAEMVITGAGPAVTLALALFFTLVAFILPVSFWAIAPAVVNWVLFIFNLLPIFPMDGGRFFRAVLAWELDYKIATYIAVRVGQVLAVGFCILGIYFVAPMWLLTMGLVMMLGQLELKHVEAGK